MTVDEVAEDYGFRQWLAARPGLWSKVGPRRIERSLNRLQRSSARKNGISECHAALVFA